VKIGCWDFDKPSRRRRETPSTCCHQGTWVQLGGMAGLIIHEDASFR
jgi:hypothetical protein